MAAESSQAGRAPSPVQQGNLTRAGAAAGPAPLPQEGQLGSAFSSSAEKNAETEAKLHLGSSGAATAAERQG